MIRAKLDREPRDVAAMFDAVAERYDVMNLVMTLGQERRWRRAALDALDPKPGERILDLAAGTGASSAPIVDRGAAVVACDFSAGMLQTGHLRHGGLGFVAGDALSLPFRPASFDAVTISFGLRNFADLDAALAEMRRVTAPAGRFVALETSTPRARPVRAAHRLHTTRVLPLLARALSSNADAYIYLAESMADWPDQPTLAKRIAAAGWKDVAWRDLSGGAVAVHRAISGA